MISSTTEAPGRPIDCDPVAKELYETWLVPNGIDEWVPEDATFVVDDLTITYTRFARHSCDGTPPSGWDLGAFIMQSEISQDPDDPAVVTYERVVALTAPVTGRVRELFSESTCSLVEKPADSGYAAGGQIAPAGDSASDSIPAFLTNDYVLPPPAAGHRGG